MTTYDDVWDNITFPSEKGYSNDELKEYLEDIVDWIKANKPTQLDIEMHIDDTMSGFCKAYPHLKQSWLKAIGLALIS